MCALEVSLEVAVERIPTVRAVITNTSNVKTITTIVWNSPLDDSALDAGVFSLVVLPTAQQLQAPGLNGSGLVPLREDLAEFRPGSSVSHSIPIRASWIPRQGQYCRVQARGRWTAVREKPINEVSDEEIKEAVTKGDMGESFASNIVEISLT